MSTVTVAVPGLTDEGSTPAGTSTELVVGSEDTSVNDVDVNTASGGVGVGVGVGQSAVGWMKLVKHNGPKCQSKRTWCSGWRDDQPG